MNLDLGYTRKENPHPFIMKHYPTAKNADIRTEEKKSEEILIEKMGLPKKELEQINDIYGVTATQIVEFMQLSKYKFIYEENEGMSGQSRLNLNSQTTFPFF